MDEAKVRALFTVADPGIALEGSMSSLFVFLLLFFGGICVSLRGWLNLDNDRRLLSAAWIGGGLLISGSGLCLWLFPSAWSWCP